MQTQVQSAPAKPDMLDDELNHLAELVRSRQQLRQARENFAAYQLMSSRRLAHLQTLIQIAETEVSLCAGVRS